jgi:putative tricarboxylic transport membrane protein
MSAAPPTADEGAAVRREDLVVAGLCLLAAAVTLTESIPRYFGSQGIGPGAFPTCVAVVLAVCGAGYLVQAARQGGLAPSVGWPRGEALRRVVLATASLVLYLLVLPWLGFTLSSAALLIFHFRLLGDYSWRFAVIVGVVAAVLIWFVFAGLLFMSLPRGLIGL